jgi:hypothetical protein
MCGVRYVLAPLGPRETGLPGRLQFCVHRAWGVLVPVGEGVGLQTRDREKHP